MTHPPTARAPSRDAAAATPCANAIFQQPWWLDAMAPDGWDEAVIERNGRTVARLPYVVRRHRPLRILTEPPFTQMLGPWIERRDAKTAYALGDHSVRAAATGFG